MMTMMITLLHHCSFINTHNNSLVRLPPKVELLLQAGGEWWVARIERAAMHVWCCGYACRGDTLSLQTNAPVYGSGCWMELRYASNRSAKRSPCTRSCT